LSRSCQNTSIIETLVVIN